MNGSPRFLALLASLALLLGCGTQPERSIASTLSADQMDNFSVWSEPMSLGPAINASGFNDQQAVLSKDGLSLYFASNRPGSLGTQGLLDIWVSQRACADDSCPWATAVSLGPTVNSSASDFAPALSRDEHWLFFGSGRQAGAAGSGDIWVSFRAGVHDDFGWQAPVNLGAGVNTSGFEGGPAYFENADVGASQLLFNRNPLPVNTGGDIYVSEQAPDGSWSAAVPVPELNTDSSDQHPSVAPNGVEIYFHSNRLGSTLDPLGTTTSNDIWVSTRESVLAPWSPPTNLGAPINTAADESGAVIFSHGQTEELFFTRNVATPPAIDRDIFVSTRTRGGNAP
ncbi:MAG TPA: hypothetical protein VGQ29_09140 [Gemmatimonadales bacterium]|jgi:hypothetical protein|nr:hypothetical protein [Gemmatimonadales bacterium]